MTTMPARAGPPALLEASSHRVGLPKQAVCPCAKTRSYVHEWRQRTEGSNLTRENGSIRAVRRSGS